MTLARVVLALALAGCASPAPPPTCPQPPAAPHVDLAPALAPLAFLIGTWDAGTEAAKGGTTFEATAQGHAIVRTNYSESPKGRHDDTMLVVATPQGTRAVYADNEGHAIDYAVTSDGKTATFLSAEGPGPRFRLTYALAPDGAVAGKFELQPPGGSDFKPYLAWTMQKRQNAK